MFKMLIAPVIILSLSGCASLDTKLISDAEIANYRAEDIKRGQEAQARVDELLRQGAMHPNDRFEVELHQLYLDNKYPDAKVTPQ